ncbi:Cof-type HAD-IIB family hydrolase [Marinococcus halotolerans]|uniref:Cof-type HAD-IIB family hydrolase n=1 Tax=Marinococcus halotolerans TaxID=301092 RepID=UPI0003B4559F|nr:Cof-type HAD-IIB family hydrolase [Marinococcus halotolerans]
MKLIAVDLDGTLIKKDRSISTENVKAIKAAQEKGDIVAVCSGRSLQDTEDILKLAGLDCPMMVGNGAWTYQDGESIDQLVMPEGITEELLPELENEKWYYEIYTNQGVILLEGGKERLRAEVQKVQQENEEVTTAWSEEEMGIQYAQHGTGYMKDYRDVDPATAEIYKIFVLSFDRKRLKKLRDRLSPRTDVSLTSSGITKLEIAHPSVSKGYALRRMAEEMGVPLEHTAAIGDNLNDLSMFEIAGTSIAMGNAVEEVIEAGDYVTKSYMEDGVAYALKNYL